MKKMFALMHKPTFMSSKRDSLVSVFENEKDAKEALEL